MLEFLFLGLAAASATLFASRHHSAVIRAAAQVQIRDFKAADNQLDGALRSWPTFPWERNRRAICLNLRIHLKQLQGDSHSAESLCSQLLSEKNLATPIQALTYDRLAAMSDDDQAQIYLEKSAKLWESGIHELEALKMWEILAYFFWALSEPERAAYCFEQVTKSPLHVQNAFIRFLCYVDQGLPTMRLVKEGLRALEVSKAGYQKASILCTLAKVQYADQNYEEAYSYNTSSLEIAKGSILVIALHLQTSCLRAMERYEEAASVRAQWVNALGPDQLVKMLGLLHDEGEYEASLDLLNTHSRPDGPDLQYAWGIILLELGDPAAAQSHLEQALTYPASPSPAWNLVRVHREFLEREKMEHYLVSLPREEMEMADMLKAWLAYFWDGQPEAGSTLGVESIDALYHGDFERHLSQTMTHIKEAYAHAPLEFKTANVAYHRAASLHWAGRYEEALRNFQQAESNFLSSPFQRARCQLRALECQAAMGNDVLAELQPFVQQLRVNYATSDRFSLELESVELHCLFYAGHFQTVVDSISAYLKRDPRKFEKARHLKLKAQALDAQGLDASQMLQPIINLAPQSFLAAWAEGRVGE